LKFERNGEAFCKDTKCIYKLINNKVSKHE